jgi:hypothetical protein
MEKYANRNALSLKRHARRNAHRSRRVFAAGKNPQGSTVALVEKIEKKEAQMIPQILAAQPNLPAESCASRHRNQFCGILGNIVSPPALSHSLLRGS